MLTCVQLRWYQDILHHQDIVTMYKFMAFYMYTRIWNICTGMSAQKASEVALQKMADRVKGHGGVVTVSKDGDIGKHFTTERMAWAWIKAGKLHYGLNCGEDFIAAE